MAEVLNLLGCNTRSDSSPIPTNRFSTSTQSTFDDNDVDEENEGNLESSFPPERESRIQQLLRIARGEKGAKRNFLKNLFGLNKHFKAGQKLPSSSYKLDKDDAKTLTDLEKELEQYNKSFH